MPKLRLRYSIRALLVLMAVVGALCYYALMPWRNAYRFVNAVQNGQTDVAEQMLLRNSSSVHSAAVQLRYDMSVAPVSMERLWNGETIINAHVPAEEDMPGGTWFRATRKGISPGAITW
jgi:hypothetical protein